MPCAGAALAHCQVQVAPGPGAAGRQTPGWLPLACPWAAGLREGNPVAGHWAFLWALLLLRSVLGSLASRNLTEGRGREAIQGCALPALCLDTEGPWEILSLLLPALGPLGPSGQHAW